MARTRRMRPPGPRCLRTYRRIAQKEYFCDTTDCAYYFIMPGDEYVGEVWAYGDGWLKVKRNHVYCPKLDPPHEDRDSDHEHDFEKDEVKTSAKRAA